MISPPETCQLCQQLSESLQERHGVPMCGTCKTLFWFAEILLEADVTEEEIVPTLAFAPYAEGLWTLRKPEEREAAARKLANYHPAFELVKVVSGIPVLRLKHALVEVVRYQGSDLPRSIRIRILSRFAEPEAIAERYWAMCDREGLPRYQTSPGRLLWDFQHEHLVVDVGPHEEIEPARLRVLSDYPQFPQFAFPLDTVVNGLLRGLLGQGHEKNLMYGALLSDLGRGTRISPEATVTACVVWYLQGERTPTRVPRDDEVARIVSQSLLEPLEKKGITTSRDDATWRNAKKVSQRLDLCSYLLQQAIG
jgi:hypothetical protein